VIDLRSSFVRTSYGGMAYQAFAEGILPGFLAGFEAVLSKQGRSFIACDRLTVADFAFHEVLDGIETMVKELSEPKGKDAFESFPAIKAYKARFEALPKIAAYRSSEGYMARPFNNVVASWK
jgi:glutathione S-transferase